MALGGGTFLVQNKILPGTYINFVSIPRPSNIFGDRGYAAVALELDWGDPLITTVEPADLQKDALKLFGYSYTDERLRPIREIMKHASTAYIGRLNGDGEKAKASLEGLTIEAKYPGTRGNDLTIVVENEVLDTGNFVVKTMLDGLEVDRQIVAKSEDLKENAFVTFTGNAELKVNAGLKLTGGTTNEVSKEAHTKFLDELEKYYVNTVGYVGVDEQLKSLYAEYAKRLRDKEGTKLQVVLYGDKKENNEAVISIDTEADEFAPGLVYWVTGAEAGCPVNKSLTNRRYDGEYTVSKGYKQRDLIKLLQEGKLVFHTVDKEVRILEDINSFTEFEPEKNEDFSKNQVIRVIDQTAMDFAKIFNTKYLGKVPNDPEGRISLWNDFVKHAETLQKIRAIQNFVPEDITVMQGDEKGAVYVEFRIQPTMAMTKLYVVVRIA